MRGLFNRDRLAGWAFYAGALLLLNKRTGPGSNPLLRSHPQFAVILLPSILLCLATGWGVKNGRLWARWTGLLPCSVYLALGFPWWSVLGAAGLGFLWTRSGLRRGKLTSEEFWNPRRQSGWTLIASVLVWRAGFALMRTVLPGTQATALKGTGLIAFLLLLYVHIAIHECGHAIAALLAGFKIRVLAVGPFVFTKKSERFNMKFEWKRLIAVDGFAGAVPVSPQGLRMREILVVAAGPAVSLLAGAYLLAVTLLLPGTPYQDFSGLTATAALIGLCLGVFNLIPFGYCDGTMLFHLLLRTKRGEDLLTILQRGSRAGNRHGGLSEKRETLRRLLQNPHPDPVQLGNHYISLAQTEISMHLRRDAESHIRQGLELVAGSTELTAETDAWESLHSIRMSRHDHAGAAEAYRNALAAAQRFLAKSPNPLQHVQLGIRIARLHIQAHAWDRALEEIAATLTDCPDSKEWCMRKGVLLAFRARALLQTGRAQEGQEALEQAAAIYRANPASSFAPSGIGILGRTLWGVGRTEDGIAMVREGISMFEARGESQKTTALRLNLAEMFLAGGRTAEAAGAMPPLQQVEADLLRSYYEHLAVIHKSEGKLREAIEDRSKVVALSEQQLPGEVAPLAEARAGLAEALADAGELQRAEVLARQAGGPLEEAGHPDFGRASVVLAMVGWRRGGSAGGHVAAALRCWNAARTLLPSEKARRLEQAAKSLESVELTGAAAELRRAAAEHWQSLAGVPSREDLLVAESV